MKRPVAEWELRIEICGMGVTDCDLRNGAGPSAITVSYVILWPKFIIHIAGFEFYYCICSLGRDRVFFFPRPVFGRGGRVFCKTRVGILFRHGFLTFPVPVLCQTNTIRNICHLEKVDFGGVFCFPWEAFVTLGLRPRDAKLSLRQQKPFQNPLFSRYEITISH
jgi:hypothetical protein